jgi:4-amino-4-deoxy-L-arabinose transferase-like glycosyltransferase
MLYCLLLLTALRLVLCAAVPLAPDEAYYYAWSAHLQGGYFDHPPMVALMIRAGTWVAGPTPLGIRFMGPVLAAAGTALVWDAGEQLFPQRQTGLYAALFLNATLMVGAGAIIMTPDTPLLFFWAAGIAALGRLVRTGDARWWLAVGVACGGMLLSKYTSILFIAAVFLWAITRPAGRAWLRTPWPWAGLTLALAIFSPNIAWNAAHGWVSYLKQGSRTTGFDAGRSLQFLGEFAVAQIALATPVIFVRGTLPLGPGRGQLGGDRVSVRLHRGGVPACGGAAALGATGGRGRPRADRCRLCAGPRRAAAGAGKIRPDGAAIIRLAGARRCGGGTGAGVHHLRRLRDDGGAGL